MAETQQKSRPKEAAQVVKGETGQTQQEQDERGQGQAEVASAGYGDDTIQQEVVVKVKAKKPRPKQYEQSGLTWVQRLAASSYGYSVDKYLLCSSHAVVSNMPILGFYTLIRIYADVEEVDKDTLLISKDSLTTGKFEILAKLKFGEKAEVGCLIFCSVCGKSIPCNLTVGFIQHGINSMLEITLERVKPIDPPTINVNRDAGKFQPPLSDRLTELLVLFSKAEEAAKNNQALPIFDVDSYMMLAGRTMTDVDDEEVGLLVAALGMTGEAGEFAEIVKKWKYHSHEFDRERAIKELGDICWYIARACVAMNVKLSDVLGVNIKKLIDRYPEGFSPEKSQNRAPTDES